MENKQCFDAKFAYHLISSLKQMRKKDGKPFITNGVTLPFLAYAYKKLNGDDSVVSVEYMNNILKILEGADENFFVLEMCSEIDERVIAIYSDVNRNYYIAEGFYNIPEKSHLWRDPKAHNPCQFQRAMCALYKDVVTDRLYSRVYSEYRYSWSTISEEEDNAIQTIIEQNANDYIWFSPHDFELIKVVDEAKDAYELIARFFDEFVAVKYHENPIFLFVSEASVDQQSQIKQISNYRDLLELYPAPLLNDDQYFFIEIEMKLIGQQLQYQFPTALCEHPDSAKRRVYLQCHPHAEGWVEEWINDPMLIINKAMSILNPHKEDSPYLYRKMAALYYRARGAVAWYNHLDKKIREY